VFDQCWSAVSWGVSNLCGSSAVGEGLVVNCCRMLSVWDRAAMIVRLEAGLSQVRIADRVGRSPSVMCHEITRHPRL